MKMCIDLGSSVAPQDNGKRTSNLRNINSTRESGRGQLTAMSCDTRAPGGKEAIAQKELNKERPSPWPRRAERRTS
eukprot:scaffold1220_cov259-Pinguiococcus_pyrenoidosus.AAC.73